MLSAKHGDDMTHNLHKHLNRRRRIAAGTIEHLSGYGVFDAETRQDVTAAALQREANALSEIEAAMEKHGISRDA